MRRFGIDISHHQTTVGVPWRDLSARGAFIYIRATYGTTPDRRTAEHVTLAKKHGLDWGLYHFFRAVKDVNEQLDAFDAVAQSVGYGVGNLAPALDVEQDMSRKVVPGWSEPARRASERLRSDYSDCVIYITRREWVALGRPEWVLDRPLWVAHYTGREAPYSPGHKPWYIWQYTVRSYAPDASSWAYEPGARFALDHNVMAGPALKILPVEEQDTLRPEPPDRQPGVSEIPYVRLTDDIRDAMRRERDAAVKSRES